MKKIELTDREIYFIRIALSEKIAEQIEICKNNSSQAEKNHLEELKNIRNKFLNNK